MLRVIYPFNVVFGQDFTSFLETDAYNRMYYARHIAELLTDSPWQAFIFTFQNNLLFSGLVAVLSLALPLELVGAWLPPLLAVAAMLVTYLLGKELFNQSIGLLSALFVALIPSEFFHRTLLGFADHHALETLLLVTSILFIVRAIKAGGMFNRYVLYAAGAIFLYTANYFSGLYLMSLLVFGAAVAFAVYNIKNRQPFYTSLPLLVMPLTMAFILYLPLGGFERVAWFIPQGASNTAVAIQRTQETLNTFFTPISQRTISELMPLLYPFGKFNPGVVITNLHVFTLTFLAGLPLLWKYRHDKGALLLFVWTMIVLALTLNHRRFMYYLTINVGIISAVAIYLLAKRTKGNAAQNAMIVAIPLVLLSLFLCRAVAIHVPSQMSPEWHSALVWLKQQPNNGRVTAWGDYGHWIQYTSDKTPNYMPGPGGELVAQLYFSTEDEEAISLMNQMGTGYLIVDLLTITAKYHALTIHAGYDATDRTQALYFRLFYENRAPPYLSLVYESTTIKIYAYSPPG